MRLLERIQAASSFKLAEQEEYAFLLPKREPFIGCKTVWQCKKRKVAWESAG